MSDDFPRIRWQSLTLQLRNPFRLSYGVSETRRAFWLRLTDDEGWGEAAIPPYYGISDEAMIACWEAVRRRTDSFPDELAGIEAWIGMDGPAPARAALDLALHDRIARRRGVPLHRLLDLPAPIPLPTSFTIAIGESAEMARLAGEAARYPVLKIKVGLDTDEATLAAVRSVTKKPLRVDANEGWKDKEEAVRKINWLESQGVELIEQPMPAAMLEEQRWVRSKVHIPIIADEACLRPQDIPKLADAFDGINVKIDKAGGLLQGYRMLQIASSLGLKTMLGCMVSSSVAITAAAHLSPLVDYADLDGNLLISNDPYTGVTVKDGRLILPEGSGLGLKAAVGSQRPASSSG